MLQTLGCNPSARCMTDSPIESAALDRVLNSAIANADNRALYPMGVAFVGEAARRGFSHDLGFHENTIYQRLSTRKLPVCSSLNCIRKFTT